MLLPADQISRSVDPGRLVHHQSLEHGSPNADTQKDTEGCSENYIDTWTPRMPKMMKNVQQMRTMLPIGRSDDSRVCTTSFRPGARLITLYSALGRAQNIDETSINVSRFCSRAESIRFENIIHDSRLGRKAISAVRICRSINRSLISSLLLKSDVKLQETKIHGSPAL